MRQSALPATELSQRSRRRVAGLLLVPLLTITAPGQESSIARALKRPPRAHPRLIMDEAKAAVVKRAVAEDELMREAFAYVRASANLSLKAKPVERTKVGKRLLGASRTCLKRVLFSAFSYRMTGHRPYLDAARKEMLAAAAFSDWNPSHFLDVAEMTTALALGYDWLFHDLDDAARATIRDAIIEKGLRPSLLGGWWVTTTNNWNQVCHGGLSLGALAVYEDARPLAERILERTLRQLPRATHEYAPDGAYPEGPGYWKYGTSYNILLIDALRTALGDDFGTFPDVLAKSASYYLHMTGPTGLFFNYSDCGRSGGVAPAMYWFAGKGRDPSLLWNERRALAAHLRAPRPTANHRDRIFPLLILWHPPQGETIAPRTRHFRAAGRTPIATHRTGWDDRATFVGIKGGSPGANHAHMDIGSFVIDADGVRWAHDLGSQNYHSLESKGIALWNRSQRSKRWSVFRLNNLSHNTLVVDGKHQRVAGASPILRSEHTESRGFTILDMGAAYDGQLLGARRGIMLRGDRSVLVQDEVKTLDQETVIRWGMVTKATVSLDGHRADLAKGGASLRLEVLEPQGATLTLVDTARPPASHDQANPGTRMIAFEVVIPPATKGRLAVLLTPGSAESASPTLRPLSRW